MKCYRTTREGSARAVVAVDGTAYDLTAVEPSIHGFEDIARVAGERDTSIEAVIRETIPDAPELDVETLAETAEIPLTAEEIWAAGVTYEISEAAREEESGVEQLYLDVYEAERPELFLKSTARRVVGPDGTIGVREDSGWDVPEPELGIVLYEGEIVGYTVGNDVSSRAIEGANPLYLPQAKIYDRSCSIGPCVVPATTRSDWDDRPMSMQIRRDGDVVFDGETSTSKMVRSHEELVSYLTRHNDIPASTVLLTGTSLVPDDEFTLTEGDTVEITIDGIGRLTNDVTTV